LDGVLADFDTGVVRATGKLPAQLGDQVMWPLLARTPGFYDTLGRQLYVGVKAKF